MRVILNQAAPRQLHFSFFLFFLQTLNFERTAHTDKAQCETVPEEPTENYRPFICVHFRRLTIPEGIVAGHHIVWYFIIDKPIWWYILN